MIVPGGVEGYAPSGNAGGRALAGVCGGKAPTSSRISWSINAFCVTVKAFSWTSKCKKIVHNIQCWVLNYACEIIQASKDIQSDAVVTSPDLGGQNVFKTFKMAIRQNRRTTSTELNKIFCRWIYFHLLFKKYFFYPPGAGGEGQSPTSLPLWISQWSLA